MRENWIKTRGLFFPASCRYRQQVPAGSTDDTMVLKSQNNLPTEKKKYCLIYKQVLFYYIFALSTVILVVSTNDVAVQHDSEKD